MERRNVTKKFNVGDEIKIISFATGGYFSINDLIDGKIIEEKYIRNIKHLVVKTDKDLFLLTEKVISYFNIEPIEDNQNKYVSSTEYLPILDIAVLIATGKERPSYDIKYLGIYKGSIGEYKTIGFAWKNGGRGIKGTYWREIPKLDYE
jgi:hypothetical protein